MANLLHKFQLDFFALGAKLVERKGQRFLAIPIDPEMCINENHAYVDFVSFEKETEYSTAYIIRSRQKGAERQPICGSIRKHKPKERQVDENWDE